MVGRMGLTRHVDILIYSRCGDSHYRVDLRGVLLARSGWRDTASALSSVEQASGISMLALAGLTASISPHLIFPPSSLLAQRLRHSFLVFANVSTRMFSSWSGRLMIGYFAVFLSPFRVVFQSI